MCTHRRHSTVINLNQGNPKKMNDQTWKEIVKVLNDADRPLNVLEIVKVLNDADRPLNVLEIVKVLNDADRPKFLIVQPNKKLLNKILYQKYDEGLIIRNQPNGRHSKPFWSLPENRNKEDNYNANHNNNISPQIRSKDNQKYNSYDNINKYKSMQYSTAELKHNQFKQLQKYERQKQDKFKYWLCNTVKLQKYLSTFIKHEYNDITMIEFIDQDVLKNELKITIPTHTKLLLSHIDQFKSMRYDYHLFIQNKTFQPFQDILIKNGILTIPDLKKDITTKRSVQKLLNIHNSQQLQRILHLIETFTATKMTTLFTDDLNVQSNNLNLEQINQISITSQPVRTETNRILTGGMNIRDKPMTQIKYNINEFNALQNKIMSDTQNVQLILNDFKQVNKNISKIIGSTFSDGILREQNTFVNQEYYAKNIGDKYFSTYLYHIHISENPNNCSFGILTPKPIPEFCIPHISFPIQIQKNVEKKHKDNINKVIDDKNKEGGKGLKMFLEFEQQFQQNSVVTLHMVNSVGDDMEHKINQNAFQRIKDVNKFLFEKLDQKPYSYHTKHPKLQLFHPNEIKLRNKYYLICPLIQTDHSKSWEIDYKTLQTIHTASGYATNGKKITGTQWCALFKTNLKNELVETQQEIKSKNAQERYMYSLCTSYGFDKRKYLKIREKRQMKQLDDVKLETIAAIKAVDFFADEYIVCAWKSMNAANKKKLFSPKYESQYVLLLREEQPTIPNVLISTHQKPLSGFCVQSKLRYECLEQIFPTGIKTSMWEALKNMPSILWSIENWLNVMDVLVTFSNIKNDSNLFQQTDEMKINVQDININLSLLYHVFHRSKISTNMNYQIFNNVGAYVLKFLCTLFFFSNDVSSDVAELNENVRDIMEKTETKNLLGDIADNYNLMLYAILLEFNFKTWNPPQFKLRNKNYNKNYNNNYNKNYNKN
eukprot:267913_1